MEKTLAVHLAEKLEEVALEIEKVRDTNIPFFSSLLFAKNFNEAAEIVRSHK
jgi:hypothetical protein